MLNAYQIARVWEHMLAAETRALYFGIAPSTCTSTCAGARGPSCSA